MEQRVMPTLKEMLTQAIDSQRPSLVLKALLLVALLVDGVRPLPAELEMHLAERVKLLARIMEPEDYTKLSNYPAFFEYVKQMSIPLGAEDGIWAEFAYLQNMLPDMRFECDT